MGFAGSYSGYCSSSKAGETRSTSATGCLIQSAASGALAGPWKALGVGRGLRAKASAGFTGGMIPRVVVARSATTTGGVIGSVAVGIQ